MNEKGVREAIGRRVAAQANERAAAKLRRAALAGMALATLAALVALAALVGAGFVLLELGARLGAQ